MDTSITKPEPPQVLDSSQYIRTYAKDFAALAAKGTPVPLPETPPEKPAKHKWGRTAQADIPGVDAQQKPIDLSILEQQADRSKEEENIAAFGVPKIEKTFELGRIDDGDIVQGRVERVAPTEIEQALSELPQTPVSAPESAPASAPVANERQTILERLHMKSRHAPETSMPAMSVMPSGPSAFPQVPIQQEVVPPPIPTPPSPPPAPTPLPQPSSLPTFSPILAPTFAPEAVSSIPKTSSDAPSPLHTYTSDFADRIDEKKASKFSVLAADKDAKPVRQIKQKKNWLAPVLGGALLIIIGCGAVGAAYYVLNAKAPIALIATPQSLFAPDQRVQLSGNGSEVLDQLVKEAGQQIPANAVVQTYLTISTTTSTGTEKIPQSGGALLTALNFPAPDILLRNIDPTSMIGVTHAGTQTAPFFILRVTSYERTFAGMLEWEGDMSQDLVALYPSYPDTSAYTSTGSSTQAVITPSNPGQFTDEVVASHNTRVLRDGQGRSVLIYGYADAQTLIIARDEAAFELLLGRLQSNGH